MAILRVPSQYATISAAITACSSGDEIVVSSGNYAEVLTFTSKNNVLVRAETNHLVNVTGTGTIVPFPATCHRITFQGIRFVRTGTSTVGLVTSASSAVRGCKFIDCTFDFSGMGATSSTGDFILLYPGDANSPSLIRRCYFVGNGSTARFGTYLRWATASATDQTILVEANYFHNVHGNTMSPHYMVYLNGGASTNGRYVARNNTFRSCRCYKTIIRVVGGATASGACYNNIAHSHTFHTPAAAAYLYVVATGLTRYCGQNTGHNTSGVTTLVADPDSGGNDYTNPQVDLDGSIASTSPSYRTGVASSGLGEQRIQLSRGRIPYANIPSRGAKELYVSGRPLLHLKHKYIVPMSGMVFNMTGQAAPTLPSDIRSFESPMELAEYIERSIQPTKGLEYGPIEFWFDFENARYRAACYQHTFALSCSGNAAILFGTQSLTAQTDTG